jgi:DNA repair exonuclease SbcCD nuclease subunit
LTSPRPDLKFIHLADTHLGLNWPAIGRQEHIQIPVYGRAFATVVDAALAHQVDFVVHGGDLVDRPRPPTAAWNRVLQELPKLKNAGIPFIVTPGSHDKPQSYFDKAGGDILEILDKRLGLAKRVDAGGEPVRFEAGSGKKVVIYGLGEYESDQETDLQRLEEAMREGPEFKIVIMHGSVSSMPNLVGPTTKSETINELLSRGLVDYVALGHNHKRWEHQQMHIYNPGSPEITSFADAATVSYTLSDGGTLLEDSRETVQHGYYLVELNGEIINARFIPLQTRDVKNIQIHFNGAKASQVIETAKEAIFKHLSQESIIRLIFTGTLHPSASRTEIDLREILSLKEKLLYLDYPLMNFEQDANRLQYTQTSDLNSILEQYFTSVVGDSGHETAKIAIKILQVYEKKTKMAQQEALDIVDQWKPQQ